MRFELICDPEIDETHFLRLEPLAGPEVGFQPTMRFELMNDVFDDRGERETILVVDDSPEPIAALTAMLRRDYRVLVATNGRDALRLARERLPGLILLDIMMPDMSGHDVCVALKSDLRTREIPVIFITSSSDEGNEQLGLELGAVDYIHKPLNPALVRQRVRNHVELQDQHRALERRVRERTSELEESRVELIRRLCRAAEYRDNETGMHVIRMSQVSRLLALAARVPEPQAELLMLAAPMHDVGKIGTPDRILLKPGRLDDEERAIMQQHTLIGAEIIGEHDSELLRLARTVALTHHEKWDGSGYPHGLAGADIPLEGRIVAIADVYDALTSERPYKRAWEPDAAFAYIQAQAGLSFDPELVDAFLGLREQILEVGASYPDHPAGVARAATVAS